MKKEKSDFLIFPGYTESILNAESFSFQRAIQPEFASALKFADIPMVFWIVVIIPVPQRLWR